MDIRIEQRPIYHLELTEAQARAVVADPAQLQAELAAVLNASGLTVTKPQAKRLQAPKSHSTKTTKAYTCNKCGQGGFHDKRQLFLHRKAAHPTLPTGEAQA